MLFGTVPGVNKPVARLVQGTTMISPKEQDRSFKLLDEVFAQGCQTFDTAHVYGTGESERSLGAWMADRGVRDQVVVISKGAHHNPDRQRVTPYDITADLNDSLARLKTEKIDLYMLHRDNPAVPVSEIVDVLNAHLQAGKIGAIGASNWSVKRIQEANAYAKANGLSPFVASSPNFSLTVQIKAPWTNCVSISGDAGKIERTWYGISKFPLFTWSSLAGGFLSGRYQSDQREGPFNDSDQVCLGIYGSEANFRRLERAEILAKEHGVSVPQLATAYVLRQPLNVFALVGCFTGEEFASNAAALEIPLSPADLAWLSLESENR